MAAKKTSKNSSSKKSPSKSGSRSTQKNNSNNSSKAKVRRVGRSLGMKIMPYVFCALAVIFAVCFILVAFEAGAGVLGEGMFSFFSAMFGTAAYGLPLVLGYIGVRWCIHNIRWNEDTMKRDSEQHVDYIKAKRKLVLVTVMTLLSFLFISALVGVIAEQSDFDLGYFWSDGWDGEGGGIFGGSLACFFLLFETVLAIVIIVIALIFFIPLAIGITPDFILTRIREHHIEKVAQRAEEDELIAEQNEQQKSKSPTPVPVPVAKEKPQRENEKPVRNMSVDEILEPSNSKEQVTDTSAPAAEKKIEKKTNEGPLDFGGDDGFGTSEFDNIDNIIKGFDTPIAEARRSEDTVMEEQSTPSPTPTPVPFDISQISEDEIARDVAAVVPEEDDDYTEVITPYVFPSMDFLVANKDVDTTDHTEELQQNAKALVETLRSFRVGIQEVTYSRGPTITRYELKPDVGTRVRSIANLRDDIALNLATSGVRIEAPIPGKAAVGIEVPNQTRATVYLRDLVDTPKFTDSKSKLTAALGMDVAGNPIHFDIAKMPHLLIAGTTGSGKSICINCIILSILYKAKPDEVKLILIDPKKVEFNMYKNIPHLYCPIVSEPKKAAGALSSAVSEMERRFELIEQAGVRDIGSYNAAAESDPELEFMPHMVIIIDELADLMMTARDEVETSICRIAQKARAAGIHMILGTQRPSVDVITGLIKANVPSRIACTVMSQVDSRTIIDVAGAENLIGRGDMLFAPVGASKPMRVQGAFVSENEIEKIVSFIKENNGEARYNTDFINKIEEEAAKCGMSKKGASFSDADASDHDGGDSKFKDAVKLAIESGKISTSLMQRRLGVGYGRAAKIIDTMEQMGYVSAQDGNKPRNVLITMEEYMNRVAEGTLGGDD